MDCILTIMDLQQNVPLAEYSTMRLGGPARYLLEVHNTNDLADAVELAKRHNLEIIMIGGGSNIIWRDEGFPGLVIANRIKGFEIVSDDETGCYVNIGAGEEWDSVVDRTVKMGLSGIECLSLIPGTAGATPIQNVGAYGQDISQTLMTLIAYDTKTSSLVTLTGSECGFAYRKSIFNTSQSRRYYITSITLLLNKSNPMPPFYSTLATYLEKQGIKQYTPAVIREAVIAIRRQRLPDPAVIPNTGSFFANPIVDSSVLESIKEYYNQVPNWPLDNGMIKLSAAWLIDQAGYNNFYDPETGMATWEQQPLVFVNRSARSTADLIKFVDKIRRTVKDRFAVELELEPLILP